MRTSHAVKVGLVLVLVPAGWLGVRAYWHATRSWIPLDMPVSLAPRHSRTTQFAINLESKYSLAVALDSSAGLEPGPCSEYLSICRISVALISATWALSKNGEVVASGLAEPESGALWSAQADRVLGDFRLQRGQYVLDLDFKTDLGRLNRYQPRLVVYEDGGSFFRSSDQRALALSALLLLGPVGICVMIRASVLRNEHKQTAFFRTWSLTQPGPGANGAVVWSQAGRRSYALFRFLPRKPHATPPPFSRLSWHVLIIVTVYSLVFFVLVVFRLATHPEPHGLRVRLVRPEITTVAGPGLQPVLVRLFPRGVSDADLYIGSRLVAWDDASAVLRSELARRPPDWPVYVQGEREVAFEHVVRAIDVVKGTGAQVVLLTHQDASGQSATVTPTRR